MGVVPQHPLPTYPGGFPPEVLDTLERVTGLGFCCNLPYSGTQVIEDFGEHHLETGEVILYTSADSVLQLAAHVDVLSEPDLYAACEAARAALRGERGRAGDRPPVRGSARRLPAPRGPARLRGSAARALLPRGDPGRREEVHAVGKVRDLFAGVGIDAKHEGATNAKGIAATTELLRELRSGLIFVNLVETDQLYGHRHDVEGFHAALQEIDAAVAHWLDLLRGDDLLVLTADHGVDPDAPHTDHTREYSPLLATFAGQDGRRHDGPLADVGATALRRLTGREAPALPGRPFA